MRVFLPDRLGSSHKGTETQRTCSGSGGPSTFTVRPLSLTFQFGEPKFGGTAGLCGLEPLAAGVAKTPEDSEHTSIKARVDHARETGTLADTVDQPTDRTRVDTGPEYEAFWLVPIAERREHGGSRAGISPSMNLASYQRLLDWTARLFRRGKARLPADGVDAETRLR